MQEKGKLFRLSDFIKDGESCHIARVAIHSSHDLSLHYHDYAEIFWVEQGSGFHIINGHKVLLKPGNLVMVRPADEHTFTSAKDGLTVMNLAFPVQTLDFLKQRYFKNTSSYFWTGTLLPYQVTIDEALIQRISQRAEKTWRYKNSIFHLDALLLFIFELILADTQSDLNNKIPEWLNHAIKAYTTPQLFKQGAKGFADVCGRNIDHINRVARTCFNKTLTDLITEQRMFFAARQLTMTNVPIKVICNDCGFTNLAHFYKTFKSFFKQTPIAYRKTNQTIV